MQKQLFQSTALIAVLTLVSRIFGLIRDLMLARFFAAGLILDTFLVAFKIPNFMRQIFAEGAFSQAFIPILNEYKENYSSKQLHCFISTLGTALAAVVFIFITVSFFLSSYWILIFAPGFYHHPGQWHLASQFLQILLPYLLFISLTAFFSAILNSYGYFALPAWTPLLLNIAMIMASIVFAYSKQPAIHLLPVAVLIAGFLQMSLHAIWLYRKKLIQIYILNWKHPGLRRVCILMGAGLLGVCISQLGSLINMVFASFLKKGSISWLYYAQRLMQLPLGVLAVATSTVILPRLSSAFAKTSSKQFSQTMDWGLKMLLIFSIPASLGLFYLAGPVLVTLFYYGQFSQFDVLMTQKALMASVLALVPAMLMKPLISGFYALQKVKIPIQAGFAALLINILFSFLLTKPLAHTGLALSTACSTWLNTLLLIYALKKEGYYQSQSNFLIFFLKILLASLAMLGILFFLTPSLSYWFAWSWLKRVSYLFGIILIGKLIYFGSLLSMGLKLNELREGFICD